MSIHGNGDRVATPTYCGSSNAQSQDEKSLKHGFNAMGHKVPNFRKRNTEQMLKGFGINAEDRFFIIERASEQIQRDNTHEAMEYISKYVDVTGTYMVLSCLLTGVDDDQKRAS